MGLAVQTLAEILSDLLQILAHLQHLPGETFVQQRGVFLLQRFLFGLQLFQRHLGLCQLLSLLGNLCQHHTVSDDGIVTGVFALQPELYECGSSRITIIQTEDLPINLWDVCVAAFQQYGITVTAELENGKLTDADCSYGSCVYQTNCTIAQELDKLK